MQTRSNKPVGAARPKPTDAPARAETSSVDERPFAEIRRLVHDALRLFAQHRWVFFIPFCLVTCAAFIASFYVPRTYEATSSFEVRTDPVMINLPISAGAASYKYFRKTMVQDLTATDAIAEVVDNLGLMEYAAREENGELTPAAVRRRNALARSLGAKLTVTSNSPSELMDVVRITYTGENPELGRRLVDEVKRTYIRRTGIWLREFLVQQRDYFQREAAGAAEELLAAQRDETRLRMANPHINPADPGAISLKISQLESERRELLLRRREHEAELIALRRLVASPDTDAAALPSPTHTASGTPIRAEALALAAQVQELDRNVSELRRTRGMTDQHPEIASLLARRSWLTDELAKIEAKSETPPGEFGEGAAVVVGPPAATQPHAVLDPRVVIQTGKIKELDIALESNERAMAELQEAKSQVFQKQEEFSAVMGRVHKARQRVSQLEATLAQIEPAIKAVEQNRLLHFSEGTPAYGGSIPVSPKAMTVVFLCIVAGLAAGILFVVLAEVLDHVYRSSGQVARSLGLPLLEAIDEIVTPHDRRRRLVLQAAVTPAIVVLCLGVMSLTGSIAYLSLARPGTYEKVRHIPDSVLRLFVEPTQVQAGPVVGPPET